jgi:hypothetical protein
MKTRREADDLFTISDKNRLTKNSISADADTHTHGAFPQPDGTTRFSLWAIK